MVVCSQAYRDHQIVVQVDLPFEIHTRMIKIKNSNGELGLKYLLVVEMSKSASKSKETR